MSYDVAVWVGSRPPDDTAALATFPDLDELDEHVDGSVWEEGHMIGNVMGPFFYFAMGSQSNIGGPASAPVVASVFHPSLAPVGALLGTLGYATGTVLAYLVGIMLRSMAT